MKNLLTLLFFVPLCLSAQSLWRNGAVKTTDGQVIRGQIHDQEWNANPTEIEFRAEGSETTVKYSVHDITEFSTDRPAKFVSMEVEYDAGNEKTPPSERDLPRNKANVFLEVLVDGNPSLFMYIEDNRRKHFFIRDDQPVRELLNRVFASANSQNQHEWFKQQIVLITNGCERVQRSAFQLTYTEQSLSNAIEKINACRASEIKPLWTGEAVKRKVAYVGLVAGMAAAKENLRYIESDFSKPHFGGGVFVELLNKKRPNRFSYYNELSYRKISQDAKNEFDIDASVEMQRVTLVHLFRVSRPNAKGDRLFLGLGAIHGVRWNTKATRVFNTRIFEEYEKSYEVGFAAGAGHSFSLGNTLKLNAELRYTYEKGSLGSSSHAAGLNLQFYL